jgi:hypothetical protein
LRRCRRLLSSSLAALTLVAAVPHARADGEKEDVAAYREALDAAQSAFADGDYADARAFFEEAYSIHPEPVLRFNIASTYRREDDLESALAEYRAFLDDAPANDPNRARAEATVAELEAKIAEENAPPPLPPPPEIEIEPEAREAPRASSNSLPRADELMRWGGLAAGAASVVTLGVALLAVRDAGAAERELEALPSGQPWGYEEQALYDLGRSARTRAIVWSVATAALAGGGLALYLYGDRKSHELTVAPTSDGGVVSYSGSF